MGALMLGSEGTCSGCDSCGGATTNNCYDSITLQRPDGCSYITCNEISMASATPIAGDPPIGILIEGGIDSDPAVNARVCLDPMASAEDDLTFQLVYRDIDDGDEYHIDVTVDVIDRTDITLEEVDCSTILAPEEFGGCAQETGRTDAVPRCFSLAVDASDNAVVDLAMREDGEVIFPLKNDWTSPWVGTTAYCFVYGKSYRLTATVWSGGADPVEKSLDLMY